MCVSEVVSEYEGRADLYLLQVDRLILIKMPYFSAIGKSRKKHQNYFLITAGGREPCAALSAAIFRWL